MDRIAGLGFQSLGRMIIVGAKYDEKEDKNRGEEEALKDGAVTEMVEAETKIKSKLILLEDGEQRSQGLIHVIKERDSWRPGGLTITDEYVKHWSAMAADVCISGCPVKGLLQKPPDLFSCMDSDRTTGSCFCKEDDDDNKEEGRVIDKSRRNKILNLMGEPSPVRTVSTKAKIVMQCTREPRYLITTKQ
ncbi:hypothetical protein ACSQ67_025389 [Phaseolus vulgaris]